MPVKMKFLAIYSALFCSLSLLICVVAAHPVLEMAINDDWSYVWSARVLATTGHVVYNGWATAMLGWQLYLGAVFIKLFGFSFMVVRMSIMVVAMVTVALTQRLLVRLGINEWNATIATLTIGLSPVFLPLAFSFMSDVPGFFCILLCFYCCVRAMEAKSDRAMLGWLVFAALSNVACGTVRQIAWLGALVIVPSTAWWLRRRAGALAIGAGLWLVSAAVIAYCMHWFSLQPYSITEKLIVQSTDLATLAEIARTLVRNGFALCLFVSPVLLAFLLKYPLSNPKARGRAAVAGLLFASFVAELVIRHKLSYWLAPFSHNYVTEKGLVDVAGLIGNQPTVIPYSVQVLLTLMSFAIPFGLGLYVWNAADLKDQVLPDSFRIPWDAIFTLFGPFTLAYLFLLATRGEIFDRYLLPLLFVVLAVSLRFYEQKVNRYLPATSAFLVMVFAAFGVAGMHDLFAMDRARLAAANEMIAAGIARTAIEGGLEYDAWTQLEGAGYVNDKRLRIPAGAYQPGKQPVDARADCRFGFSGHTPLVEPRYVLSYDQNSCYPPSTFAPVPYTAWLGRHDRAIFIQKLP